MADEQQDLPQPQNSGDKRIVHDHAKVSAALQQAQEALATSESRLEAILAAAVDFAIITVNANGVILDWSLGAERIFGYTPEEAIGQHTEILFTPEDRHGGIPMVEIEVAKRTGRSMDERWHLRKDGSRFFISGVMTPLNGGPVEGFVKVARNVTDRKLAEEALFLSEERKSLAVRSAQMGEWEWDLVTDRVDISDTVRALFGIHNDLQVTGQGFWSQMIYPPDETTVRRQLDDALHGLQIFQAEYRIIRADSQEIRWVNAYGRVIGQDKGKPSRMIGVIYDITRRKMLEIQKDDFISLASHELKTPVTAIKMFGELLEEHLAESGSPQSVSILKRLNGQVDRLIKLIQSLLDTSALSEGRMQMHPETFDLNDAISEQLDAYQRIAGQRQVLWRPQPIAMVHADKDRIVQVVTNFVSNALKYSPREGQIVISTEDRLDSVMVKVEDGGRGIPPELQRFLFDRYYRVPGDQENAEGFGMGLYISAAIVRQHMGTIGVQSTPGKGATFFFTLPYS